MLPRNIIRLLKGNYLNAGVSIARIVDLNTLRTEIAVSEREISQVKTGSTATIKRSVDENRIQILEGVLTGETVIMSALGTLAPNNPVIQLKPQQV